MINIYKYINNIYNTYDKITKLLIFNTLYAIFCRLY